MKPGLLALAIGGFGIGLTEFVIAGLLPEVAADFAVDETTAGGLISGYALAVALGAVPLTAGVARIPRKVVLLGLMSLFVLGNLLCAVAPTYDAMMAGRVVAALCHGAFFGIGSVVAADMVAPDRKAGAIAMMFGGLTLANVLGVPAGTLVGQLWGWRAAFWAITVIGVLALLAIALLVPRQRAVQADLRSEARAFAEPQVWVSLLLTVIGYGGMFGAFTYIAFTLTGVTGFASAAVPGLLVLFGVGLVVGNVLGGRAANRSVHLTLVIAMGALVVVMVLFALTATSKPMTVLSLLLMGGFGFALVPALQMRVMSHAGEAPTLASGANIAAFNLGNALGAWLGGVTIAAGLGYVSPLWAGAALTTAALVVLVLAGPRRAPRGSRATLASTTGTSTPEAISAL